MPAIKILNREYQISCGPGEEEKLLSLAAKLDKRLSENAKVFKGANENMLFLLTALTMEDSLQDLSQQISGLQKNIGANVAIDNHELDQIIEKLADRIDSLCSLITQS